MNREKVVIAEVLRPRGNRGEMVVESQTDVPGRFEQLKSAHAQLPDGSDVAVEIEAAWLHEGRWVLKFAGVNSISGAERFRGADLWIAREERGRLPEGEYFESDLVDCLVIDAASGRELGRVEGWQASGGPPLMQLTTGGRKVLIPFVRGICVDVNLPAREIRVVLPEGLLDL